MKIIKIILWACGILSLLQAGTGGKISGTVRSANGEPLVGVNIVVDATDFGTASDENGDYYILNIPPGLYDIRFSSIGYKTLIQQEVRLISDHTTRLDATLEISALDAEVVTVTAERPLIRTDITSKVSIVGADEIINMPVHDFKDVLATSAGFTTDADGGIHVRGGRTREILYMINGVIVEDPMSGDFSGTVNQNTIQEMSIISGTFNAEYGQAMSAVVNLITKEGTPELKGKLELISDQLNASPYHSKFAFASVQDSAYRYVNLQDHLFTYLDNYPAGALKPVLPLLNLPVSGSLNLNLGGQIPHTPVNWFSSFYYEVLDSPLPHGISILQDNQLTLSARITPKLKLIADLQTTGHLYQNYSHPWKYRPLHQTHTLKTNDRIMLKLTQTTSQSFYHSLSLSRFRVGTHTAVGSKTPDEYTKPLTDASVYFYASGDQGVYTNNLSTSDLIKYDLTLQMTKNSQLKSGFTFTRHNLDIYHEEEPWTSGVNFIDDSTFTPTEGSFYVQNKFEFDYVNLNLGLRYDYLNPATGMWQDVQHFVVWDSTAAAYLPAPILDVPAESKWSPRIGIAYPLSEESVFHFSYGHFFQSPDFNAITYNARKDVSASLPLLGNPRIKSQKTVSFETGLKQSLSQNIALEVTAWMKDIRDLLSTVQIRYLSEQYVVFDNTDYASVKGIDITLRKRPSGMISGSLNYTLSVAKGNNSTPLSGYFSAYFLEEVPHEEFYLDFDQRHDISLDVNLVTPSRGFVPLLNNITANLLFTAASGLPYTPYVDPSVRVEINSARMPWTYSADIRIKKRIQLDRSLFTLFLEVINLTDHQNVLRVYSITGKPFDSGTVGSVGSSQDADHNPASVGPGRTIKLGASIEL
ncbi:MAG: TonB-dependent receptor [FCB group bacterium]|nr:TonB-dependent receptor [FCB group bacterium]